MMTDIMTRHRATWRAVAATVVPELAHADEAAWREVEATVARVLASRPARLRRQLAALLRLIGWLARARFGRALGEVDAARRERFLLGLHRSRLRPLRRGVWGLRTLVLLGHYTRPQVMRAVGYRADARGWAARLASAAAARDERTRARGEAR